MLRRCLASTKFLLPLKGSTAEYAIEGWHNGSFPIFQQGERALMSRMTWFHSSSSGMDSQTTAARCVQGSVFGFLLVECKGDVGCGIFLMSS